LALQFQGRRFLEIDQSETRASSLFENTKFDIKWSERLEKIEVIFDAEILTKEILRMNKSIEPKLISCG
jgi:hypothetical protein